MKRYLYTFRLTPAFAHGAVPFDMLRYDSCFPLGSQDAAVLETIAREHKAQPFNVGAWHEGSKWQPEVARWASFGWTVSDVRRGA